MARTIHNDHERYLKQYWNDYPGKYFTQDGACKDSDGYYWILGRIDDVINVSGHRLSTMEIESALVSHHNVIEAAVVGKNDHIKGNAVCCFLVTNHKNLESKSFTNEIKQHIREKIGSIAIPDNIFLSQSLPKTRSGKIMRRLLRDIVEGRKPQGDLSTIEENGIIDEMTQITQHIL